MLTDHGLHGGQAKDAQAHGARQVALQEGLQRGRGWTWGGADGMSCAGQVSCRLAGTQTSRHKQRTPPHLHQPVRVGVGRPSDVHHKRLADDV